VGIEALSRGASQVTFVERAPAALSALRANLEKLGLTAGFRIQPGSVKAFLQRVNPKQAVQFDLVFLDPPYDADKEYAGTLGLLGGELSALLAPQAMVIAEHRRKEKLAESYGLLARTRLLEQGDAALSFYAVSPVENRQ
jgi:16S rRNA (guanine(966)-N(2))-methyltransferase RsmD